MKKKKTYDEAIEILESYGLKICEGEIYKNINIKIKCIDSDGYVVYARINDLQRGRLPHRFGKGNHLTIENIKHYIEVTDDCKDIELISDKYERSDKKLTFRCKKHGEFKMSWNNFYSGHMCPKCGIESRAIEKRKSQEEIIKILEKYNLQICEGEIYKNNQTLIKCVDSEGYIVYPTINGLQQGYKPNKFGKRNPSTIENIKHYIEITDNCRDIELVSDNFKNANSKLTFNCKKHGEFKMTWSCFYSGQRCYKCNQSKGEIRIEQWLKENDVKYETQYTFKDCKHKKPLPFDFYLPDYNVCIEYDGRQHEEPVCFGGINEKQALKEFRLTQKRDKLKDEYCKTNKIPLLRIPYTEFDNIETILENFLKDMK